MTPDIEKVGRNVSNELVELLETIFPPQLITDTTPHDTIMFNAGKAWMINYLIHAKAVAESTDDNNV